MRSDHVENNTWTAPGGGGGVDTNPAPWQQLDTRFRDVLRLLHLLLILPTQRHDRSTTDPRPNHNRSTTEAPNLPPSCGGCSVLRSPVRLPPTTDPPSASPAPSLLSSSLISDLLLSRSYELFHILINRPAVALLSSHRARFSLLFLFKLLGP